MRRVLRWLRNAVFALAALLLVAAAMVYAASERIIRHRYEEPLRPIADPADSASIAEGDRLTWIHGCRGCHTPTLTGQLFVDDPMLALLTAPNLTESARKYSDEELTRIIRRGVRPDGRSVWAMPSEMFAPLSDADLGLILASVRSVPPGPGASPRFTPGPLGRFGLVTGEFRPAAAWVQSADSVTAAGVFPAPGEPHAQGAYLVRTSCTECHDLTLNGVGKAPDLRIAAGYTRGQFGHFFKTGEAQGGRELAMMSGVARRRFSHFTDAEVDSIYAFLVARAAALPASGSP